MPIFPRSDPSPKAAASPRPLPRWAATAVLVILAVHARPGAARASGCHAPERPTLGLSPSWDLRDAGLAGARETRPASMTDLRTPLVRPRPCSGEAAGTATRVAAPQPPGIPAAAIFAPPPAPIPGPGRLEPDLRGPSRRADRLDRPPRRDARPA